MYRQIHIFIRCGSATSLTNNRGIALTSQFLEGLIAARNYLAYNGGLAALDQLIAEHQSGKLENTSRPFPRRLEFRSHPSTFSSFDKCQ